MRRGEPPTPMRWLANRADVTMSPQIPEAGRPAGWMTTEEAAEYLGLPSVEALYRRIERGQVPARRWGRQYRFRRQDLDALMGREA